MLVNMISVIHEGKWVTSFDLQHTCFPQEGLAKILWLYETLPFGIYMALTLLANMLLVQLILGEMRDLCFHKWLVMMGSAKGLLLCPSWLSELSDMQDWGYPVCVAGFNPAVQIPRSEEKWWGTGRRCCSDGALCTAAVVGQSSLYICGLATACSHLHTTLPSPHTYKCCDNVSPLNMKTNKYS